MIRSIIQLYSRRLDLPKMVQESVRFHRENIHPYEIFHRDLFEYVQLLFSSDFVQLNEVFVRYVQFLFKEKTELFLFVSQQISCSH